MDFEKFLQLVLQVTGSLSSWQTLVANLLSFVGVIFFRHQINKFYATLDGMDNSIVTVATYGLLISAYVALYKSVSAVFRGFSRYREARNNEQELSRRQETLKQTLLDLSRKEIAILKFLLNQEYNVAWLPTHIKPVLMLKKKGIICLFSNAEKNISHQSLYYSDSFSHAQMFTIPDDVLKLITQIKPDASPKWRKTKPDHTFSDFQ